MFKINLYKYDSTQAANGYRGINGDDYSRFVAQGQDLTEDITQVMDTAEITLYGLPKKEAFDPESKFICDIVEYDESGLEAIVETVHLVVSRDIVSQPILSDDTYFDHHISFIEPSVIAQKRLVDNISSTYQLKDVTLEEHAVYPPDSNTLALAPLVDTGDSKTIQVLTANPVFPDVYGKSEWLRGPAGMQSLQYWTAYGKNFRFSGNTGFILKDGSLTMNVYQDISQFAEYVQQPDGTTYAMAQFQLPQLQIWAGRDGMSQLGRLGNVSYDYTIYEYDLNNTTPNRSITGSIITNNTIHPEPLLPAAFKGEWLVESENWNDSGLHSTPPIKYCKRYTDTSAPTPSYVTPKFRVNPAKRYKIFFYLHDFGDSSTPITDGYGIHTGNRTALGGSFYTQSHQEGITYRFYSVEPAIPLNNNQTTAEIEFTMYDIATKTVVFTSGVPYSALTLLQKAIVNSALYEKKTGVYVGDVNLSDMPFYIENSWADKLQGTQIIENFYNQKNLWEIMIEVGHYIHAIPEIRFGDDDKFIITFNELGRTDEKQNQSTRVSIFNSRSVEDYISATSSYVTNMVQLGGYIEEWVSPKTTSDTYLVSNDTADIIVSKPIIELLQIFVRNNNNPNEEPKDITNYIFEENVYATLSIDYRVVPNRGIALYYQLGSNIITGGTYQLPQSNTNMYTDYTIKKIIYSAYNGYPVLGNPPDSYAWNNIKVNDYSFLVKYRTKDSVRQTHTRPDLRKYLLNSKYDKFPQHNQFNNQEDIVVDSIKFGNNLYGKLIKTGNNSYDIYDWNTSWNTVKHKGELYRINGELYYVATVKHVIYNSYILSQVTYSKDYNELSNVIGIPSEPRFYEISEQSEIRRDFEINDLLLLTDSEKKLDYNNSFVQSYNHLSQLILGEGTNFAQYAITVFKGDKDASLTDPATGDSNAYTEIMNPINAYSSENTLTYAYDMEDNYSAGNHLVDPTAPIGTTDKAYMSLEAVRYTDQYGRSPLLDFYILGNIPTPTPAQTKDFPVSSISTKKKADRKKLIWDKQTQTQKEVLVDQDKAFVGDLDILASNVRAYSTDFNGKGIGLLKDCREAISVNYNLRLITSSDTFVLSPYFFLPRKSGVKFVLLAEEVNKLSSGLIDIGQIITPLDRNGDEIKPTAIPNAQGGFDYYPYFPFSIAGKTHTTGWGKSVMEHFYINLASVFANVDPRHFTGADGFTRVKAFAVICDASLNPSPTSVVNQTLPYKKRFVFARNIPEEWTLEEILCVLYFGAPKKSTLFNNIQ